MSECCCRVDFEILDPEELLFDIGGGDGEIGMETGDPVIVSAVFPDYDGSYEVEPAINREQVLGTRNRVLRDDVTVHEILVASVSNPQGGQTVTIGIV